MPLKILLVDDHAVVREGYRRLLERDRSLVIVAEAGNADMAYRMFCAHQPDVVVLDIALPGASGLDAMGRMRARDDQVRFLVCSMYEDPIYIERSFDQGASAYVSKASAADELGRAIQAVSRGERFVSSDLAGALAQWQKREHAALATLNPREMEVLRLLVRGVSVEAIALEMKLSEKTISNYQTQIRQKLGARNATQLVHAASRLGISAAIGPQAS